MGDDRLPLRAAASRGRPDPLFSRLFVLATSVNFLPAALGWENMPELVVLAALHLVFINRVRLARSFAASQRGKDLRTVCVAATRSYGGDGGRGTRSTRRHGDTELVSFFFMKY